ncbi:hypothetical protein FRC07_002732 [Ceratobasidium sp. 392]|nr:hypothetical protein FRC07_002732 [Ceratobasidium sp. 392]
MPPPPTREPTVAKPPPPTREPTSTTVPETPSRTRSFGATQSQAGKTMPALPRIFSPTRGPTHTRLRAEVVERFLAHFEHKAADAQPAPSAADEEVDELAPTDTEEVPKTVVDGSRPASWWSLIKEHGTRKPPALPPAPAPGLDPTPTPTHTRSTATQRTYKKGRSHVASQSNANASRADNDAGPSVRPNSPSLTQAELIVRERTRALEAKVAANARKQSKKQSRPGHLFANASQPPVTRPQARAPLGASANLPAAHNQGTRRPDPVSAALQDMANFTNAIRDENTTGFVQSVTRQAKRKGRCAPAPRPLHEWLEDNEEDLAHAEARANSEWPSGSSPRGRTRKQKPLARDVRGIDRQILTLAKIHLFAYAIFEGAWQTRATFLLWAEAVYYATWQMELPTTPFVKPPHEYLEIMVNGLATARGKCKEHARSFTEHVHGFVRRMMDQRVIQENLNKFNLLFPNNFHCASYCPREGHYESPNIPHAIASMLFHSPSSVGNLFPDYFVKMPLTMVAYVLTIRQFSIEEWASGTHQNGNLGMASMDERFEGMMSGLKDLNRRAPKRMARLQKEWRKYVREYSGAALPDTSDEELEIPVVGQASEIRPDTPELELDVEMEDAMSVEELNAQLLETARQESLRERMHKIKAREEIEPDEGELADDEEPA